MPRNYLPRDVDLCQEATTGLWLDLQYNNDPKHTCKTKQKWFNDHRIKILTWLSQTLDPTLTEQGEEENSKRKKKRT